MRRIFIWPQYAFILNPSLVAQPYLHRGVDVQQAEDKATWGTTCAVDSIVPDHIEFYHKKPTTYNMIGVH